jgi:hypothetical protein
MSAEQRPPSDRQMRYLRSLAGTRGETFGYPRSSAEASAEIERLLGRKRQHVAVRHDEVKRVRSDVAELGDAASVREHEVTGYGSSARWR